MRSSLLSTRILTHAHEFFRFVNTSTSPMIPTITASRAMSVNPSITGAYKDGSYGAIVRM